MMNRVLHVVAKENIRGGETHMVVVLLMLYLPTCGKENIKELLFVSVG